MYLWINEATVLHNLSDVGMSTLFHHLIAFLARAIVVGTARVLSVTLALAYHLLTAPWRAPVGSAILATFIVIVTNNSLIHYHHIVAVVLHIGIVLATGRYYYRQHHNHHNHNLLHNLNFLNVIHFVFISGAKIRRFIGLRNWLSLNS